MQHEVKVEKVKKMVEVEETKKVYILKLNEFEAQSLKMICGLVGGLGKRRKVSDEIFNALNTHCELRYMANEFTGNLYNG